MWNDFIRDFKKAFAPSDSQGTAMAQLLNLRQGRRSLTEYIADFNQLAIRAKVNDHINKCNYFVAGLEEGFMTKLFNTGQCSLDNYDTLLDNANQLANDQLRLESFKRRQGFRTNNYQNNNRNQPFRPRYIASPSHSSPARDPNAMDVDTVNVRLGKLTNEEREDLHRKNACFRCRKPGHVSRDCRSNMFTAAQKGKAPQARVAKIEEVSPDEEDIAACRVQLDF